MRSLLFAFSFAVTVLLFLAPGAAEASERSFTSPFDAAFGLAQGERGDSAFDLGDVGVPRGPVEDPADWIAVVGIACYAIIPVVLVIGAGFIAYEVWTRNSDASLLSARSAWVVRGARPPPGLVLLHF